MAFISKLSDVMSPAEAAVFTHGLRAYVDDEKVKHHLQAAAKAKVERVLGPRVVEGLGQKTLNVPMRTYIRWAQQYPGCWSDTQFVDEFKRDNPDCRAS